MKSLARAILGISVVFVTTNAMTPADSLAERILTRTLQCHYAEAAMTADTLTKLEAARGAFFSNMVRLSRFDDLGDTNELLRARQTLENATWPDPFWESLRMFQLGFVKSEQGDKVSAGWTTRKAAKGFAQIPTQESRAFYAIYAYYMEGATAWVPFASDNRTQMLRTLDSAAHSKSLFWPLFSTSLTWMRFDRKEYSQALTLVDFALQRAPSHPVYTQMRADMLFRLQRYPEAATLYEQSALHYAQSSPGCIRWWCAAANLLRIYAAQKDTAKLQSWQAKFQSPAFAKIRKWMPASLIDALEDQDLLPD